MQWIVVDAKSRFAVRDGWSHFIGIPGQIGQSHLAMARYRNPWQLPEQSLWHIMRWKLGMIAAEPRAVDGVGNAPADREELDAASMACPPERGWRVVWLGHASFLLQGCGISLLIDPAFSSHCGPLPLPFLRRKVDPPCTIESLPSIDAVLLTHSHYDHLDLQTLRLLGNGTSIIVPEGHAGWLGKKGFPRVRELSWRASLDLLGIRITATPARHFTARTPFDRDRGHWCGWLIEGGGCKLWHAGDTGYCPAFQEIGEHHGPIDLGMIPIGAYGPRRVMEPVHLDPEEAVRVFKDSRCLKAVPMHWGTFQITDEPLGEPPIRLAQACGKLGVDPELFSPVKIGMPIEVMPVST